ncbi:MAG TPA: hypothetical protein VIK53_14945, partial [Verrucomicrobiae bacterium]
MAREMFHAAHKMNATINGRGSEKASPPSMSQDKTAQSIPALPPQPQSAPLAHDGNESRVVFHTAAEVALRGVPLSITRHAVIFELY